MKYLDQETPLSKSETPQRFLMPGFWRQETSQIATPFLNRK
jgi:hypothetical protein